MGEPRGGNHAAHLNSLFLGPLFLDIVILIALGQHPSKNVLPEWTLFAEFLTELASWTPMREQF